MSESGAPNLVVGLFGGSVVCLVRSTFPCLHGLPHTDVSARLHRRMSRAAAAVACVHHTWVRTLLSPFCRVLGQHVQRVPNGFVRGSHVFFMCECPEMG